MSEIAEREIDELARRHPLQAAAADAGDHPRDHPARPSSASAGASGWTSLRAALREFLDLTTEPAVAAAAAPASGPTGSGEFPAPSAAASTASTS